MDTRRWGPGERIVFEPYTKEVFDETFKWIADRGIFADTGMGTQDYESSIVTNAGEHSGSASPDLRGEAARLTDISPRLRYCRGTGS